MLARSSRLFLILSVAAASAFSQIRLSPGIRIGTPLTDTLISSSSSSSDATSSSFSRSSSVTKRLLVGPSLRLELPRGLGLEFDALYQRINSDYASGSQSTGYSDRVFEQSTANRWQFPFLLQYGHRMGKLNPFVEAGPSISAMLGGKSAYYSTSSILLSPATTSTSTGSLPASANAGITAGGGIEIPAFGHHLRADIRFSHWFAASGVGYSGFVLFNVGAFAIPSVAPINSLPGSFSPSGFSEHPNEASFLLGFSF